MNFTDRFMEDLTPFLIAMLITALIFFIIGWLIGKSKSDTVTTSVDTDDSSSRALKDKCDQCEDANKKLHQEINDLKKENRDLRVGLKSNSKTTKVSAAGSTPKVTASNSLSASNTAKKKDSTAKAPKAKSSSVQNFDKTAAKSAMGKNIKADDLKLVEGIGPKIESLLKDNGITTWSDLANANADAVKKILLDKGGSRFQMHDPSTWAQQAKLAHEGKWGDLKSLQDKLSGGRVK